MRTLPILALTLPLVVAGGAAQAQDQGLTISAGIKAWATQWTTFSYAPAVGGGSNLIQVAARDKTVLVPLLGARWGNVVGSVSGYASTQYEFVTGGGDRRSEYDLNLGYLVTPGVALTLGYKKVSQRGDFIYEPAGPVAGISATAPLGGAFSLYGAFGYGWMKTPRSSDPRIVEFDADYRLAELGVTYGLALPGFPRTLTFTAGYRLQVLSSKEAQGAQDGRDLTQGLTLGVIAGF